MTFYDLLMYWTQDFALWYSQVYLNAGEHTALRDLVFWIAQAVLTQ